MACCVLSRRGVNSEQCTETDTEVARRYACMPGSLERALAAFQREGVRFAIARRGRALLGDEMGAQCRIQLAACACTQQGFDKDSHVALEGQGRVLHNNPVPVAT